MCGKLRQCCKAVPVADTSNSASLLQAACWCLRDSEVPSVPSRIGAAGQAESASPTLRKATSKALTLNMRQFTTFRPI